MCGRFYVDDDTMQEIERIAGRVDRANAVTGDVHPSERALVMRSAGEEIGAEALTWGYESHGRKGVIFNARSETVRERPMFRRDYETRRCVVPARKFYEWKTLSPKQKEKYEFFVPGRILYLAGIYHRSPQGDRFAVLTREAEGCMAQIHGRMPVILNAGDIRRWLFSGEDAVRLLESHFRELQAEKSGGEDYEQTSFL